MSIYRVSGLNQLKLWFCLWCLDWKSSSVLWPVFNQPLYTHNHVMIPSEDTHTSLSLWRLSLIHQLLDSRRWMLNTEHNWAVQRHQQYLGVEGKTFFYIYIYTQTHTVPAFNLPAYTRNKKWGEVTVNKTLMPPPPLNLWTFVQGKKTDLHHSSGDVINITLNDAASLLKTFSSFSKQFFSH